MLQEVGYIFICFVCFFNLLGVEIIVVIVE